MKLQQKTIKQLRILINEKTEYRSGPELVKFFNNLGFQDTYSQGFPSRWCYTEDKLNQINGTEKIEKLKLKAIPPLSVRTPINEYPIFEFHPVVIQPHRKRKRSRTSDRI